LYEVTHPTEALDKGLRASTISKVFGPPHHGGTMFRREAYVGAGGYRIPFFVAQDLDLWLRLAEIGQCLGIEQVFYQARMDISSISSRRRNEQMHMTELALRCRFARSLVGTDALVLASRQPRFRPKGRLTRRERARFNYFVGSCIGRRDRMAARRYYGAAVRANPLHLKAFVRFVMTV
jgi:hypothetical protein